MEGEAFGANMILISTIERNYTMSKDPQYQQKQFSKNKISGSNNLKYMVLENLSDDILTDSIVHSTTRLPLYNSSRSFIKIKTPLSEIEHDVGDIYRKRTRMIDNSNDEEIIDFPMANKGKLSNSEEIISLSNIGNKKGNIHFRGKSKNRGMLFNIGNEYIPTPSEFEVPPPLVSFKDYIRANIKLTNPINPSQKYTKENKKITPYQAESMLQLYKHKLQDVEIPPLPKNNDKIYGQWTSSQFANSVLNYLKRFNNEYKNQIGVPPTIPLIRTLDNFPYASDFKVTKLQPPLEFQRKKITDSYIDSNKRVGKYPQINIEILQDDLRTQIMKSHANTRPKNIEINNRGQIKNIKEHRNYRNVDNQLSDREEHSSNILNSSPFLSNIKTSLKNNPPQFDLYKGNSLTTMLPFKKTSEYLNSKEDNKNDMYIRTLSNDYEWHNVNLFNKLYTPRPFNLEWKKIDAGIEKKLTEVNKKKSPIKLKYIPENHKIVKNLDDSEILDARNLAMEISNLSNLNTFSNFSILKYNQGFLPIKNKYKNGDNKSNTINMKNGNGKRDLNKDNFNRNVKLGNALNEKFIIGFSEEQNKQSFVGGNEKIPDVGRYRADTDRGSEKVPPSLGSSICKNVELSSRQFYVQPDGSVDVTHIWSPIKEKNVGVYFVLQNYKKCSLEESSFQRHPLLLIDWNKTPVRLFGGANPKKTTDLCGFF